MKRFILYILASLILTSAPCQDFLKILKLKPKSSLSEKDVINGLKTALNIGTDTAVSITSALNGYYGDKIIKIMLPPEAKPIIQYVSIIPGGSKMAEDVIKSINRSAEEAAKEAAPIFKNAITSLTISQGWDILNGKVPGKTSSGFDSTAATGYLKNSTYKQLTDLYSPKINAALDKDLGLGFTANQAWKRLTESYNRYVVPVKKFTDPNVKPVNIDLGKYCTGKALDGLFYKVGLEEKKIRKNPFKWAVDIVQKVFGSVYKK